MSWSQSDGIDYEDAKRPTADDPTNATGWIAYYAWGRGGAGIHTPHYRYYPGEYTLDDLREYIVHNDESWMEHAEYAGIAIHRGVTPPVEKIRSKLADATTAVDLYRQRAAALTAQLIACGEEP